MSNSTKGNEHLPTVMMYTDWRPENDMSIGNVLLVDYKAKRVYSFYQSFTREEASTSIDIEHPELVSVTDLEDVIEMVGVVRSTAHAMGLGLVRPVQYVINARNELCNVFSAGDETKIIIDAEQVTEKPLAAPPAPPKEVEFTDSVSIQVSQADPNQMKFKVNAMFLLNNGLGVTASFEVPEDWCYMYGSAEGMFKKITENPGGAISSEILNILRVIAEAKLRVMSKMLSV